VAWAWEALVGVTMQSGRTVPGVENRGFLMYDVRTEVKEGELCVNISLLGMLAERQWRKSPEEAEEGAGA